MNTMAISVRQPWASLIAEGKKTIETRTRRTLYRGPLLIVASARPKGLGPVGCAMAMVDVVDCRPMTAADEPAACCPVYKGAWAWVLANVRPVPPTAVKGRLGVYRVEMGEMNEV